MSIDIKLWISDQGPISHRRPQPAVIEYYEPLVYLADVVAWLREIRSAAKYGAEKTALRRAADHLEALLKGSAK